jgi:hypothetical protein
LVKIGRGGVVFPQLGNVQMQAADCDADQDVLRSDARMKKPGTLRVRASSQLWIMAFFIQQMFRKVKENLRQENLRQI